MEKLLYFIITTVFLSFVQSVYTQERAIVVLPGEKKVLEPLTDTLWVLKDRQLKKAIMSAKRLKIEEEINAELHKKVSLLESKDLTTDSLIMDLKEDQNFYKTKWDVCSQDIDILIKKNKRQRFYTRMSLIGVVAAFIAGVIIK
ncbi:MAG: hypothetical protein ABFS35_04440 [Bacteroidota bacterium]